MPASGVVPLASPFDLSRETGSGSTASAMQGMQCAVGNADVVRKTMKRAYPVHSGVSGDGVVKGCTLSSESESIVMQHLTECRIRTQWDRGRKSIGPCR